MTISPTSPRQRAGDSPDFPDALQIGPGVTWPLRYANRHALVTGATGTGKTETLKTLAKGLAAAGAAVLVLDAKGDLGGRPEPVDLWQIGPDLLCRALGLSEAQTGAAYALHAWATDSGRPLGTLQDLRALCEAAAGQIGTLSAAYGLIQRPTLAAVQRAAMRAARDAPKAFGRPGLDLSRLAPGRVRVLDCSGLALAPATYAATVAHVLLHVYSRAPEVGDRPTPWLAIAIDESHLVFDGAPPDLVRRLASVVRLIRSKGVSLIFATQSPADLPDSVAGQLALRVQHGLRAATPGQLKSLRAAADSLPLEPGADGAALIKGLGIGWALVSSPGPDGIPGIARPVKISLTR